LSIEIDLLEMVFIDRFSLIMKRRDLKKKSARPHFKEAFEIPKQLVQLLAIRK
jgi:hypothetical protein